MANMSYCRFHNTLADLNDCFDAFGEINGLDEIEGYEEQRNAWRLIRLCQTIVNDCGEWGAQDNEPRAHVDGLAKATPE
jgi:hypothetical protein